MMGEGAEMAGEAEGAEMARVAGVAGMAGMGGTVADAGGAAGAEVEGRAADVEGVGRRKGMSGDGGAKNVASEERNSMRSCAQSTNGLWWRSQRNPITAETSESSGVTRNVMGRSLEGEK